MTTQAAELRAQLDNAEAEIRRLRRGQDNVSEGRDWSWTDEAAAIAEVWLRLYPAKAPQIASKVLELNKSTAPRKAARGRRQPELLPPIITDIEGFAADLAAGFNAVEALKARVQRVRDAHPDFSDELIARAVNRIEHPDWNEEAIAAAGREHAAIVRNILNGD